MINEEEKKAIKLLKTYENKLVYEIEDKDKKAVKILLNLINKLQKENEEKDKQIDLMAGEIEYAGCIKKVWKCDQKNCKDCIKQYFKKLAKEKGE